MFDFSVPSSLSRYLFNSPGAHMASKYTSLTDIYSTGPIVKRDILVASTCDITVSQMGQIPFEIWLVIATVVLFILLMFSGLCLVFCKITRKLNSGQKGDLEKVQMGRRRWKTRYTGDRCGFCNSPCARREKSVYGREDGYEECQLR